MTGRLGSIARVVDELSLRREGFIRKNHLWNRDAGPFVDVISIDMSKSRLSFDIACGVHDRDVYGSLWSPTEGFIDVPACTVRIGLGELSGEPSKIWDLADDRAEGDVSGRLNAETLSWFLTMHDRASMAEFLRARSRVLIPAEIAQLAILQHLSGDDAGACRTLAENRSRALGLWQSTFDDLAKQFSCVTSEP